MPPCIVLNQLASISKVTNLTYTPDKFQMVYCTEKGRKTKLFNVIQSISIDFSISFFNNMYPILPNILRYKNCFAKHKIIDQ